MGKHTDRSTSWLVTYSDFITLLLVFFVVFYAVTPDVDESKLKTLLSEFQGGEGVLTESSVIPAESVVDRRKRAERWEGLSRYIEQNQLSDQVQVDLMPAGNRIILKESLTFTSGDARLLDASASVLREITFLFDDSISEIEVQGHTDNIPVRSSRYRSNWDLGAERAISVLLFLMENTNLEPERFKVSSLGEYRPIASNESDAGRRANRRVEILIRYKSEQEMQQPSLQPGQPEVVNPGMNNSASN
jgi:chemotaxis protein MotB